MPQNLVKDFCNADRELLLSLSLLEKLDDARYSAVAPCYSAAINSHPNLHALSLTIFTYINLYEYISLLSVRSFNCVVYICVYVHGAYAHFNSGSLKYAASMRKP